MLTVWGVPVGGRRRWRSSPPRPCASPAAAGLLAHFLTGTGTGVNTLDGFGPPMRYLQTACGAPRHAGGAHWFPDTITVTVPFDRQA